MENSEVVKESVETVESLNNSKESKKKSFIKMLTDPFGKKEEEFSAEVAWYCSTHGDGTWKPVEQRISDMQSQIKHIVKSKYAPTPTANVVNYSSYHCVIDIEEDLLNYVDEILKPFKDIGFDIINLSEKCEEIDTEGIYFISWKNIFKKQRKQKEEKS